MWLSQLALVSSETDFSRRNFSKINSSLKSMLGLAKQQLIIYICMSFLLIFPPPPSGVKSNGIKKRSLYEKCMHDGRAVLEIFVTLYEYKIVCQNNHHTMGQVNNYIWELLNTIKVLLFRRKVQVFSKMDPIVTRRIPLLLDGSHC